MSDNINVKVMILHLTPDDHRVYISKILNDYPQIEIFYPETKEEQIKFAPDMQVIVGREVDLEVLEAAEKLKMYVFSGTGVDGLLKTYSKYSRKHEVVLCNTHRSSYNCSQHAVAMLLGLLNQLFIHDQRMRNQEKSQRNPESIPIRGKTIGLLGYGPINQFVRDFLKGFDVNFAILKRSWKNEDVSIDDKRYTSDELIEFLKVIDVLIIALPLTEATNGMIGEEELKALGENSFLINISRGAIIQQEALYNALKENRIAGAGLDVWYDVKEESKYGYSRDYPFHELENVILSPHRANSGGRITKWNPVFINIKKMADGDSDFVYVIDINRGY
ncbi:MAG: NAD(P)-dependent oxidoreductase [Candidatus Thorarchaeota archaeon]|jgi:D-3-phosphoglycerate dehydrogenase